MAIAMCDGAGVGAPDGAALGAGVGAEVGSAVGSSVGGAVGGSVGIAVGFAVGFAVGCCDGLLLFPKRPAAPVTVAQPHSVTVSHLRIAATISAMKHREYVKKDTGHRARSKKAQLAVLPG